MGNAADNVFIDVDKRVFYIHDEINKESMSKVCYNLLWILGKDDEGENKEKEYKRKPIKIYINSHGGYMDDMWSLVDIMTHSRTTINTYSIGYADSCGFLIFIAGEQRFITEHTRMCCHQFYGGVNGTYQEVKEGVNELDRKWKDFEDYVCKRTNITKELIDNMREKKLDWYIHSEESIKLGVATEIVEKF